MQTTIKVYTGAMTSLDELGSWWVVNSPETARIKKMILDGFRATQSRIRNKIKLQKLETG